MRQHIGSINSTNSDTGVYYMYPGTYTFILKYQIGNTEYTSHGQPRRFVVAQTERQDVQFDDSWF
jgi:hypothetical protein